MSEAIIDQVKAKLQEIIELAEFMRGYVTFVGHPKWREGDTDLSKAVAMYRTYRASLLAKVNELPA